MKGTDAMKWFLANDLKEFDVITMKDGKIGTVVMVYGPGKYEIELPDGVYTFDIDREFDYIDSIHIY